MGNAFRKVKIMRKDKKASLRGQKNFKKEFQDQYGLNQNGFNVEDVRMC